MRPYHVHCACTRHGRTTTETWDEATVEAALEALLLLQEADWDSIVVTERQPGAAPLVLASAARPPRP